ncbi:MAG: hypothetical protein AB7P67_07650 [Vicinamibacterales bacterium]|jgi:hypothetical protein
MRRDFLILTLTALLFGLVPVSAHDDYRILGTVSKVTATALDVKQRDGATVAIAMDSATRVTRDRKKVDRSEIKVGVDVAVDATGDSLQDLVAVDVMLVPATTKR